MKAVLRTLAVAGLTLGTLIALPAQAQSGYVTMGYVLSDLEPKRARSSADVDALQFGFGGWFNAEQTFAAEGRIALGLGDDSFTNQNGIRGKVEIDRYYGGYLRAQFPNTVPVRPYGLVGVTRVETTEKTNGSRGRSYSDVSLGFGVDVRLDRNIFVTLEYLRATDSSSSEVTNLTLGIGGRF